MKETGIVKPVAAKKGNWISVSIEASGQQAIGPLELDVDHMSGGVSG